MGNCHTCENHHEQSSYWNNSTYWWVLFILIVGLALWSLQRVRTRWPKPSPQPENTVASTTLFFKQ